MACIVKGCAEETRGKALMCAKHWFKLPTNLQEEARKGTEKGQHTLRVHPTREWLAAAAKYVGEIRHLIVRVDADSKVKRKFQAQPQTGQPAA